MANRLAEKLMILRDHGQGLLLRIYNMKKEFEPKSTAPTVQGPQLMVESPLLALFGESKCLTTFVKNVLSTKKFSHLSSSAFGSGKIADELNKIKMNPAVSLILDNHLETLIDVKEYYEALWSVFLETDTGYCFHLVRTPTLTINYLELVHIYASLGILLSRYQHRKLVVAIELLLKTQKGIQKGAPINSNQEIQSMSDLGQFLWKFDDPLIFLYQRRPAFEPLRMAFISTSLVYVKQCSNAVQCRKEAFLQIPPTLEVSDSEASTAAASNSLRETLDTGSCLGYPPGPESATLDQMEHWLFWGFLFCHSVVDVAKTEGGEYQIWQMMLQGMWIITLVRDEVVWIHETLVNFFRSLSRANKEEKSALKKVSDVKLMYNTALKSAANYHRDRRMFMSQLIKDYWLIFRECPGLLGPRFPHVLKLLSLAKTEVHWLARHEANVPTRKLDLQILTGGGPAPTPVSRLLRCEDFPEFLFYLVSLWSFAESKDCIVRTYYTDLVLGYDAPGLHLTLRDELEGRSHSLEGQLEISNLMKSLDRVLVLAKNRFCQPTHQDEADMEAESQATNSEAEPEATSPEAANEDNIETLLRYIELDCSRFQVLLAQRAHNPASSSGSFKTPLLVMSKLTDTLLVHCQFALGAKTEKEASDLAKTSDFSFLLLSYPRLLCGYFNMALSSPAKSRLTVVFPTICSTFPLGCHPLCPEDWIQCEESAMKLADYFLSRMSRTLFESFYKWSDHQICIELSSGLPENLAQKMLKKIRSTDAKAQKKIVKQKSNPGGVTDDVYAEMNVLIQECQRDAFSLDASFQYVTNLCWALDNSLELHPSLCPKMIFEVELKKCFEDFIRNCLASPVPEAETFQPYPSMVEAKLTVFVNCIYALSRHIDFNAMYWCSQCLHSLRSFDNPAGENYLVSFYNHVKSNLIERNLLCFSETFGQFVLPPGVEDWKEIDPSKFFKAHTLDVWLSHCELEALARLFGAQGIDYLCEAILTKGIMENANKWLAVSQKLNNQTSGSKSSGTNLSSSESGDNQQCYTEILNLCIRMGLYFCVRQLLLSALEKCSSVKMPFLHSIVTKIIPQLNTADLDEACRPLQLMGDLVGRPPLSENNEGRLVDLLRESATLKRKDLKVMMSSLATALPHAAKFTSSYFVAEVGAGEQASPVGKKTSASASGRRLCIDSHYNNLNCIAITIAHFLTASIEATAVLDSSEELGQREIFEDFISQLVNQVRVYCQTCSQSSKKEESQQMANHESVLLLLSLIADKSPVLNSAILENHYPLPVWLMQRARRRFTPKKALKSLTLDIKTINVSKAGAIKNNWNNTLKEAMV